MNPMPSSVELAATVRDLGSHEVPVAVVTFADVLGDARSLDLEPTVAIDLLVKLAQFVRQLGPGPW